MRLRPTPRARSRRLARTTMLGSLLLLLSGLTVVSSASWAAAAVGPAGSRMATMPSGSVPTAVVGNGEVDLAWAAVTLASAPVDGYRVVRRHSDTGVTEPGSGACGGVVVGTTCRDSGMAPGTWTYRIVPVLGSWKGFEGAPSLPVTVEGASAATLDASPRTLSPGEDLRVTGEGWKPATQVTVKVAGIPLCTLESGAGGGVDGSCRFDDHPAGAHALKAAAGTTVVDGGDLTVVPRLSGVTPVTSRGGTIGVRARGLAASSPLSVTLGGRPLSTQTTTNQFGDASQMSLVVPADQPLGSQVLVVSDGAGNSASSSVDVVGAGIEVRPATAHPGQSVEVVGAHWTPGTAVNMWLDSSSGSLCAPVASAAGTISATCTVPDARAGLTDVVARQGSFTSTAPLTITQVVTTPTSVTSVGAILNVTVRGFAANRTPVVTFDGATVAPTSPASMSSSGTTTVQIKVPTTSAGSHTVAVSDGVGNSASVVVQVLLPELTLSSASATPGTVLTASGRYWPASTTVQVSIGPVAACFLTTTAQGTVGPANCTVPVVPGGDQPVRAVAGAVSLPQNGVLTVLPKATIDTPRASPGQNVLLRGNGLPAGADVQFLVDDQPIGTVRTDTSGQANLTAPAPDRPAGVVQVRVSGPLGSSAPVTLQIFRPTVSLSTDVVSPSKTSVRITGSGWPADWQVSFTGQGGQPFCSPTWVTASGTIDFTCTPQSLGGGTGLPFTARVGQVVAGATYSVVANGTLSPTSAKPGATVTATGRGLYSDRNADLVVGGVVVATGKPSLDGLLQRSFTVPAGTPAGPLEVEFRQQDLPPVRMTLTVIL